MSAICPLSGSTDVSLIETIKVNHLLKLYGELLKCDISSEFGELTEIGFYHCAESNLAFFYPVVTGSEAFYKKLQKFDWYYLDDKDEYNYAIQFIKESDRVLDIGCGKGVFSKKIPTQNYVGLEFSQEAKKLALASEIVVLNESVQEHAIANPESYDVVCAFQVLEHVAEVDSFIKSSVACLKPCGLLIYSVPSADSFLSIMANNILNMPPHHITRWSDKCLNYVGQKFGLKIVGIHHEKLANIHKKIYISSIILRSFQELFGINFSLIDLSLKYKVFNSLAYIGSLLLKKGLSDNCILPNGHSVTIVYQKPMN